MEMTNNFSDYVWFSRKLKKSFSKHFLTFLTSYTKKSKTDKIWFDFIFYNSDFIISKYKGKSMND